MWSIWRDGELIGMASHTPPHDLVVTEIDSEAMRALARRLIEEKCLLEGVTGLSEAAKRFADQWCQVTSEFLKPAKALGIYELHDVKFPSLPAGTFREARASDVEVVAKWWWEFAQEIGEPLTASARPEAEQAIADHRIYVWEKDEAIMSMAGWGGITPNGLRLMLVYTPMENRRKGFASATVAALSQKMLDSGRKACFLFTDLGNPTSNHIYKAMGYRFVAECRQWRFVRGG
jgi:hypothetical protein